MRMAAAWPGLCASGHGLVNSEDARDPIVRLHCEDVCPGHFARQQWRDERMLPTATFPSGRDLGARTQSKLHSVLALH